MIQKFRLFEMLTGHEESLIYQLSEDDVDYFYNKNFKMDADEIISNWPDDIWDFIDDKRYLEDTIYDMTTSYEIEDFDESEYKMYIEKKLDDDKKKEILSIYNSSYYDEDDDDIEKESEYNDHMLEALDSDQLKEVIENVNEESEFIEYIMNNRYDGYTAKDFIEEYYGYSSFNDIYKKNEYSYKINPYDIVKKILSELDRYIDKRGLEKKYIENIEYESKTSDLENSIEYDIELQEKLLSIDNKNVIYLDKIFKHSSDDNIGNSYIFQKTFIEERIKKYKNKNKRTDTKIKDKIAEILKYLNDEYGIDKDIKKEYKDYIWLVDASAYNI